MRTAVIVFVLLVASCCAKPKPCPTLPVRPVSEPVVVTVVADPVPCELGPEPATVQIGGFTKEDMATVMANRALWVARARAAALCLRAK